MPTDHSAPGAPAVPSSSQSEVTSMFDSCSQSLWTQRISSSFGGLFDVVKNMPSAWWCGGGIGSHAYIFTFPVSFFHRWR